MAGEERRHVPQRGLARDSATRLSKNLGSVGVGSQGFGMNPREPNPVPQMQRTKSHHQERAANPGAPPPRDRKRPSPSEARVPSDSFTPASLSDRSFPQSLLSGE